MKSLQIKNLDKWFWIQSLLVIMSFIAVLAIPDISFAAETTADVKKKLNDGAIVIQGVLTGITGVIGIIAISKIVIKNMPQLDDPHVKNEMWKSIQSVFIAVACVAAAIWIVPWIYTVFA